MARRPLFRSVIAALLPLVAAPLALAAPGDVWTVAPVGADFTQIQPAVDVAADGDLILVEPGSYAQFQVVDRGLTVVAESPGSVTVAGPVRVTGLAEGRRVALIDLSVTSDGEDALILADNQGSVRVRGGTYRVLDFSMNWFDPPRAAVRALASVDVALRSVTLVGADGNFASFSPFAAPGAGGVGLEAVDSGLALYHCTLSGGDGGGDVNEESWDGAPGGHGLYVRGGFVHVVNSTLQGGKGGNGSDEDGFPPPPFIDLAGNGGNGGDGMRVVGGAAFGVSVAQVQRLAVTSAGGAGGLGGQGFFEPGGIDGLPGQALTTEGEAFVTDLPGPVARLIADGLWRPGTPEPLSVYAAPGSSAWLAVSPKADFTRVAGKQGVLLLGGKPSVKFIGTVPASGVLTLAQPKFGLPVGWDGRTLELQAWVVTPSNGTLLTGLSTTAIIDPAF